MDLDGKIVGIGDAAAQTENAMKCAKILLEEAGAKLEDVVKITIYITDRAYREPVYQVVGRWLKGVYPVSTGLIVQGLARPEYLMEIDIIAEIPSTAPSSRLGASAGKQAPKIEHWILRGDWRCGRLHKEWYGTRLADHIRLSESARSIRA